MFIKPMMSEVITLKNLKAMPQNLVTQLRRTKGQMNLTVHTKRDDYKLRTVNSHTHFEVYEKQENGIWKMISHSLVLDDYLKFAELAFHFSEDKMKEFKLDKEMEFKWLIDNMSQDEKDNLLLAVMNSHIEEEGN